MTSGKIVKKFFSKVNAASYQRAQAKKEGRIILKVRVVNAYELYQDGGWFKANPFKMLGTSRIDQYAQLNKVKAMGFVYASDSTVPVVRFGYRTTHTLGDFSFTSTSFAAPTYGYQIAA